MWFCDSQRRCCWKRGKELPTGFLKTIVEYLHISLWFWWLVRYVLDTIVVCVKQIILTLDYGKCFLIRSLFLATRWHWNCAVKVQCCVRGPKVATINQMHVVGIIGKSNKLAHSLQSHQTRLFLGATFELCWYVHCNKPIIDGPTRNMMCGKC